MRALDTNILVYAHRKDAQFHDPAVRLVKGLAEGRVPWGLPWPCVYEFYSVVTHPRIYSPPSTPTQALAQLRAWLGSPSVVLLAEPGGYFDRLERVILAGAVVGPMVHDARIAALCDAHEVKELVTMDRDFSRFPVTTVGLLDV